MHIYFSGIGGTGIGSLALIAKQAGFDVSGSDQQESNYLDALRAQDITAIHIGQTTDAIKNVHSTQPIDWLVHSSAVRADNPDLQFASSVGIKTSKRDEFLNMLLEKTDQKLIAIAGTHGKTTTTAMAIWAFKQLGVPISYSVGAKLSFGEMGEFNPKSEYFIYEADEYDRNFLSFTPELSVITGIDWDHPDIYPTRDEYYQAFRDFITKSTYTIGHPEDLQLIDISPDWNTFSPDEAIDRNAIHLTGEVNRRNALLIVQAVSELVNKPYDDLIPILSEFPGVSRRFEKIIDNIYSDYAHTPEKIRGAIGIAKETTKGDIAVVYEGLHNTRQHFIQSDLATLFEDTGTLYIVPSYLAREDESLEMLTPEKLCSITKRPETRSPKQLNEELASTIRKHAANGDLVLCLSAGGGGSLDEWLRQNFIHNVQNID